MDKSEIIQQLTHLPWSKQDANMYLTLLHLGGQTAAVVATHIRRHRITVYHALERLTEKGIVESSLRKGAKYYTALAPEALLSKYKTERRRVTSRLDIGIESLESLVPYLQKMEVRDDIGPQIQLFHGKDALKNIYQLSLEASSMYAYYYQPWPVKDRKRLSLIDEWHTAQRVKHKIPVKILIPKTDEGVQFSALKKELKETLVIPTSLFPFKDLTILTDDRMLIFSLADDMGVSIKSRYIAQNQRAIFELAWNGAKTLTNRH